MVDLVVTCPKSFWHEWIAEGDPAGSKWSGQEWGWYIRSRTRPPIEIGDRLYVVAHNRLRGYAPVTALRGLSFDPKHGAKDSAGVYTDVAELEASPPRDPIQDWCICRCGDATAVTIPEALKGFQGWRYPVWQRAAEIPFPNWRVP
ncbi:hypothetical protein [Mesorhizobium silamurunense]|uniref:hypothetical protein n=1 Tax=Mesorhizobium silamurunense TaxID=499528 RepID=UPI0017871EC7|nr:hypothetical protein [Mesorhizobium silamurunense]